MTEAVGAVVRPSLKVAVVAIRQGREVIGVALGPQVFPGDLRVVRS